MGQVRLLSGVLILALFSGCAGLGHDQVQREQLADCSQQTAAMLMDKQEQLGAFADNHVLACALNVLRDSENPAARRSALGSKLCLYLAERDANPEGREKFATDGVKFAETALAQGGETDAAVHYYLAANLGLAVRDHITLAMKNLGRLESEMQKAVKLNPDIDDGGPLRLLGALYLKAPAWPNGIGDRDKALELLQKASKEHPQHPLNHLFYAQALWDEGSDAAQIQAKSEFALGEKLLVEGNWGYSKAPWQKEFDEFRKEFSGMASLR